MSTRRRAVTGADVFRPGDLRSVLKASDPKKSGSEFVSDEEWEVIRERWSRYFYRIHRRAFGQFAKGEIDEDTLLDKLAEDRRAAKKPKGRGIGGLTSSGQKKLIKLAARSLFVRECRVRREMDARAIVIAVLSKWAAESTIYEYLKPDPPEEATQ